MRKDAIRVGMLVILLATMGAHAAHAQASNVVGWGDNSQGARSQYPLPEAATVVSGTHHNVALRSNGTVVAWGSNTHGQTNVPEFLSCEPCWVTVRKRSGPASSIALRCWAAETSSPGVRIRTVRWLSPPVLTGSSASPSVNSTISR